MMKKKDFLRIPPMALLAVGGLTACSDDEPKDSVKEVRMQGNMDPFSTV